MRPTHSAVAAARTVGDLKELVERAVGSSQLMEFVRFDAGEVLRKEQGGQRPKILRIVVGNPLIMKEMAKSVPDAASYTCPTTRWQASSLPTGVRPPSRSPGISMRRLRPCSRRPRNDGQAIR